MLAASLYDLQPWLRWSVGKTGPFASRNFEKSHSHSVVAGPGGIEERGDLQIGLTHMGPYGAFRIIFPTNLGPIFSWRLVNFVAKRMVGERLRSRRFSTPSKGEWVAFRCTRTPLLLVWCNLD
ncbi:hypothetical protein E0H36_04335 [Rhizobium leguminosarum bv. viciae]|nr:hypothetical protein CHR56_26025 [Rhizobium leguminosarum bv. viciae]MBY5488393.1 hypothetical protein [Rhizobium leguminosarum]OOO46880.1 hypothetical protein BS629_20025 [Rhizobium leguminosarum bv. viciae USDA 2370]NKK14944.1 hypothetical protein [Rhizobium leguminosarum bv. viciae]NKK31004.1 hypothetical protein [Rhizobium leguminosarum bv. viciae]